MRYVAQATTSPNGNIWTECLPRNWKRPSVSEVVWFVVPENRVTDAPITGCRERESKTRPLAGGIVQTISQPLVAISRTKSAPNFNTAVSSGLTAILPHIWRIVLIVVRRVKPIAGSGQRFLIFARPDRTGCLVRQWLNRWNRTVRHQRGSWRRNANLSNSSRHRAPPR